VVALAGTGWLAAAASEIPAEFRQNTEAFDFDRRETMVAMRDGVKLKTVVLVPKGARGRPMLLDRTPYSANRRTTRTPSPHIAAVVQPMLDTAVEAGYIVVYQDVRGKYGSEGDYVMNRPLVGPLNSSRVDHATDAYDTIEWLVHNVPESNGLVASIGGSYEGFTALMSTVRPHPALRACVAFAPMVDAWRGDDWFHHGAFRQYVAIPFIHDQESARDGGTWWSGYADAYEEYLLAGSAAAMARSRGLEQLGFWRAISAHPAYDEYWQHQAVDKLLAREPLTVPLLIIHGLFDQEDIYGGPAVYKALAAKDTAADRLHLVLGPWNHAQGRGEGRGIGSLQFEGDTAAWVRRHVMQPFLDHHVDGAPKPDLPRVLAYETGAHRWHRYDAWPQACAAGCAQPARALYLHGGGRLEFQAPEARAAAYSQYVSDPAKPVPFRERPITAPWSAGSTWGEWLVDDQRFAASRPDVLVFQTEPLTSSLHVAGEPVMRLFASTSGTDADWVVKIVDVWPSEVPGAPHLGGYQQLLSADIFRGRYREDPAKPRPLVPGAALDYRIPLPQVSHTFQKGHRVMVQIQSTWFPLYDRNPQTYVPNIMYAKPEDFASATHRIWHSGERRSHLELPVVLGEDDRTR
jgi:putative CocE/NonD family hydrolase